MYKAMNLTDLKNKYKVSIPTIKKWMQEFCPDIHFATNCNTFTPEQVKRIVESCGEFPN